MQAAATLCRAPALPARARSSQRISGRCAAVRCVAAAKQQQVQQQQQAAQHEPASAALALMPLLLAAPAWADEAAPAAEAADAAAAAGVAGPSALGWALILSPIAFYALFNVYRSVVDPRAKFGDALFIFAALVILGNIISITVFKIRLF